MRLLNVHNLQFHDFMGQDIPRYCILSHRWGDDEVSFKEFREGSKRDGEGYRKIYEFCQLVKRMPVHLDREGPWGVKMKSIDWVWIDTCCIDKRSSAELSEAINSMYDWYENATECFVYLKDVTGRLDTRTASALYQELSRSSWFERGWTLQELLAPAIVVFCNAHWEVIGHQERSFGGSLLQSVSIEFYGSSLQTWVSQITGIPKQFLSGVWIARDATIAQRMSWASQRRTSRVEDEAYCLLGIFDVNMPLIYGEGRKAFIRLQEEIIKRSTDQSILAWDQSFTSGPSVLASSPRDFPRIYDNDSEIVILDHNHYTITNRGLLIRADLSVIELADTGPVTFEYCYLSLKYCRNGSPIRILLQKARHSDLYFRGDQYMLDASYRWRETELLEDQSVYLATGNEVAMLRIYRSG